MGKTERIELRLEEGLLQRVDDWMERTGKASSRSDAVRQLVDHGLASFTGGSIALTAGDKLNFMLIRDLIKQLKVPTETNVDLVAESIFGGHYWAPTWDMQGLFHEYADRPSDVKLVVDVLDMWDFIENRLEKLSAEDVEKVKDANCGNLPTFSGFDGNNESSLMSIAYFLVEKMGRFSRFKGRDFNSHAPTALGYGRMASVFAPMRATLDRGRSLTAKQLLELLNAKDSP